ncbi:hypothetical protein HMPREF2787_03775 [Corynebacterium sp. HMSC061H03]|nr:hypothetical protein HMPREF2820_08760 [Corynebacterium sp. HMSC064E08]OFL09593.1 hypothetical protein HMPREF2788_08980 [Corynebacterium sp. HMSC063F04]OHR23577.1 hypothetical protein HMPREF2787_03775 [Corynebacterium sp. HMSC061H03]OHR32550.1 hypothetical protein HMPREF3042_06360 [Corynebacterium sp. HMSC074C05]
MWFISKTIEFVKNGLSVILKPWLRQPLHVLQEHCFRVGQSNNLKRFWEKISLVISPELLSGN